jgi:hypothetical protein
MNHKRLGNKQNCWEFQGRLEPIDREWKMETEQRKGEYHVSSYKSKNVALARQVCTQGCI